VIKEGRQYFAVLVGCIFFQFVHSLMSGALIAEGRSLLVGGVQIVQLVFGMAVSTPLFIVALKWGMFGAAGSRVLCQAVPGIVLFVLYVKGRFGIKPDMRGLFRKFSSHTWPAVEVGLSKLAMSITSTVSGLVLRKYFGLCAQYDPSISFDAALSGFNSVARILGIAIAVPGGLCVGLLPALSYANAARRPRRAFALIGHTLWISVIFALISMTVTALIPRQLSMVISRNKHFVEVTTPMLAAMNWESGFAWIGVVIQTILQALQHGIAATLYSLLGMVLFAGSVAAMYASGTRSVVQLMYAGPISSATFVVIGIVIVFSPLRTLWRSRNDGTEVSESSEQATSDSRPPPE
jgi:Na+-driven multidrug efflux pump